MPSPSINVTFVSGGTTVTVPGPPQATDVTELPNFITDLTANHTRWTYKLTGVNRYQWSIPLQALTSTQKQQLQSFFKTTVNGPSNTFTYTHTDGNTYTARFVDTALNWTRENGTMWGTTIRLETATEPV